MVSSAVGAEFITRAVSRSCLVSRSPSRWADRRTSLRNLLLRAHGAGIRWIDNIHVWPTVLVNFVVLVVKVRVCSGTVAYAISLGMRQRNILNAVGVDVASLAFEMVHFAPTGVEEQAGRSVDWVWRVVV